MLLGKNWKIESDPMNVVVSRKHMATNKKTKERHEKWVVEGYFSTVGNALDWLLNQSINETELKDLKTVQAEILRLEKMLEPSCKGLRDI